MWQEGTLHTPTGDTGVHFLWNVSGIPGPLLPPALPAEWRGGAGGGGGTSSDRRGSGGGNLHPGCSARSGFDSGGRHEQPS